MIAKTIVLADDDGDLVSLLKPCCTRRGYSVIGVNNTLDAINIIHRVVPELVCMDVNLPSGNGPSVCEVMAEDERLRSIPVVVLTGNCDEHTVRRCPDMMIYYVKKNLDVCSQIEPLFDELLGKVDELTMAPIASGPSRPGSGAPAEDRLEVLSTLKSDGSAGASPSRKPQAVENSPAGRPGKTLLDAVFAMLGSDSEYLGNRESADTEADPPASAEGGPPWVLSIDDDADFSDVLKCRLETCGVAVVRAFSGMEGYRRAFTNPASAILLDYNMPDGQGDYILGRLSDNPVTKNIPVIVITGVHDKSLERRMYALGAKCYLTKPVRFETIRDELAKYIEILPMPAETTVV